MFVTSISINLHLALSKCKLCHFNLQDIMLAGGSDAAVLPIGEKCDTVNFVFRRQLLSFFYYYFILGMLQYTSL